MQYRRSEIDSLRLTAVRWFAKTGSGQTVKHDESLAQRFDLRRFVVFFLYFAIDLDMDADWCDKRIVSLAPFDNKNGHFTKTGSGQI
jgi:hypothetical protein